MEGRLSSREWSAESLPWPRWKLDKPLMGGFLYDLGVKHEQCADAPRSRQVHCSLAMGNDFSGVVLVSK